MEWHKSEDVTLKQLGFDDIYYATWQLTQRLKYVVCRLRLTVFGIRYGYIYIYILFDYKNKNVAFSCLPSS